jgi:cell division protein FtsZ
MIHFDLPKQKSSIIKVIGVGGGGSNAVNHMQTQSIEGVDFIICNTDAQALQTSMVPNRVQLGPQLTQGLGAGANPEVGKQACEESFEEIRRILEVNTKMSFITAGMGGGTGTGAAPIIAKICRELGVLTVGIVTTPFGFEGPKRMAQAEKGINELKDHVDTLLVISNDKLRLQYGNLKMKDAFTKADNVLATAAKCITDVISSNGQINVDFADVCTVMRKGGVAILGNAAIGGENRAQLAIEEALNSPLLNDNDIRGARWILININSAEGEHEFTMDEVDVIQSYLRGQAGEETDVILGMGYDNTLEDKIGITLIATGFSHKDPFKKDDAKKGNGEEKIVMTLNVEKKVEPQPVPLFEETKEEVLNEVPSITVIASPEPAMEMEKEEDVMAPTLALAETIPPVGVLPVDERMEEVVEAHADAQVIHYQLADSINTVSDQSANLTFATVQPKEVVAEAAQPVQNANVSETKDKPHPIATGAGLLIRPTNIYAESNNQLIEEKPSMTKPLETNLFVETLSPVDQTELPDQELQMVYKDIPSADVTLPESAQRITIAAEDPAPLDDAEEQKRRAAERIAKLRNLSFNINAADPNNEFESVPAYIRRNMELYNSSLANVEDFYSRYTVKTDENNQTQISTINSFLDGKRPD